MARFRDDSWGVIGSYPTPGEYSATSAGRRRSHGRSASDPRSPSWLPPGVAVEDRRRALAGPFGRGCGKPSRRGHHCWIAKPVVVVEKTKMTPVGVRKNSRLERETGFEPATSTLARSHSTAELFPPVARSASGGDPSNRPCGRQPPTTPEGSGASSPSYGARPSGPAGLPSTAKTSPGTCLQARQVPRNSMISASRTAPPSARTE